VRQFLDVIGGGADSLRFEGISKNFAGFEFSLRRGDITEWHQTKMSSPNGNWTLNALAREGVLAAFKSRLSSDENDLCVFVSQHPAKDADALSAKARIASDCTEFQNSLGAEHGEKFRSLQETWAEDPEIAFLYLQRCRFRTESEPSIDSLISTFSDFYFLEAKGSSFAILRDFLEVRINKEITTEAARSELRKERRLALKDWSLDLTLKERLSTETKAYLDTYNPFGADGSRISRSEANHLMTKVTNANSPKVILLTGVAGSGKSGVIREFVDTLDQHDIPHLALRIDQHLDCTSPASLGKAITGREESPAATLRGIAPNQHSVLIVDQVDAVSEISGRNGAVKQTVLRLVDDARNFGLMTIVIACRTFDLENDPRLKSLKNMHGVEHVDVKLLSWDDDTKPLLAARSIDTDFLSEAQRTLLCLPLNLAIFLEVYDGTSPTFTSRNDLFARLLEKKARLVRRQRQLLWEIGAPLTKLAEWMSERQRLDAPESILSEFSGATDILSSEGLVVRSRSSLNFFHESFFDYIYAQAFVTRQETVESLLSNSEQHLFRRTQVRQILETLRQTDSPRYLRELGAVLHGERVRYHIKAAVAQWLGSLVDPLNGEMNVVLALDNGTGSFPSLLRSSLLSSAGWFDLLLREGWIHANLNNDVSERTESVLWWLSSIAGERPTEIAGLLNEWWNDSSDRATKLLSWFGFVRRQSPDSDLTDLCCRIIRSNPPGLFQDRQDNHRDLILHTWAGENPTGASEILRAYFDAWFHTHPGQHPFERDEFRALDEYSLGETAKKSPLAFVEGCLPAFVRSIDLIVARERTGDPDYSFKLRYRSGHHFGSDSFLAMLRASMRKIALEDPAAASLLLQKIDPEKHEACTHIWLETVIANGPALAVRFSRVLASPHLLDAGWHGADWKSFADAAKSTIPSLPRPEIEQLFRIISAIAPELQFAADLLHRIRCQGEEEPWQTRKSVLHYLRRSGYVQWCILETIGSELLDATLGDRLRELRRKFKGIAVEEPDHMQAHWVQSPIKRDNAVRMSDAQWLRAIERYDNDEERRRGKTWMDGGAQQLAGELQRVAKEDPVRFSGLLESIPDAANRTYISHLLWGLAEAEDPSDEVLRSAIVNAHSRPSRPYGSEIARLIAGYPSTATDPVIFEILAWYLERGDADDNEDIERSNTEREIIKIEDLLNHAGSLHVRGISGARGYAAEALASVIWHAPEDAEVFWPLLERRAEEERLVSVRCSLIHPATPLFNNDRERCGLLVARLSRSPASDDSKFSKLLREVWLKFAFPPASLPPLLRRGSVWCARRLEQWHRWLQSVPGREDSTRWLAPLLTHRGVYLTPYLLRSLPEIGQQLLYRLIVVGDDTSRMIGAWHVFCESFQNSRYVALATALANDGVVYRRLLADIAAHAVASDEFRYRAEEVLRNSFDDDDKQVRHEAGDVFREIPPNEFGRYRELAQKYVASKAFEANSWALFHALEEADCKVDDIVISASEVLIEDIERNGNGAGRRSMDLHQLQDLIRNEYSSSEGNLELRRRLLDLIDRMLELGHVDKLLTQRRAATI